MVRIKMVKPIFCKSFCGVELKGNEKRNRLDELLELWERNTL